ncbi:unnamed protein product [Lepeophtheirus salmonis]|uniref:(salmon louse) hypothetical protein n=1 Tax=Lepeophtheirus salmonis TaxID=72036 RepID=A0A7R8CJZ5_LEPSM|nr:unnamed protein product [Lepeophtheirus salmonis]CAF2842747.1 unnamed protein product [Lepeophtheirus salmonis]
MVFLLTLKILFSQVYTESSKEDIESIVKENFRIAASCYSKYEKVYSFLSWQELELRPYDLITLTNTASRCWYNTSDEPSTMVLTEVSDKLEEWKRQIITTSLLSLLSQGKHLPTTITVERQRKPDLHYGAEKVIRQKFSSEGPSTEVLHLYSVFKKKWAQINVDIEANYDGCSPTIVFEKFMNCLECNVHLFTNEAASYELAVEELDRTYENCFKLAKAYLDEVKGGMPIQHVQKSFKTAMYQKRSTKENRVQEGSDLAWNSGSILNIKDFFVCLEAYATPHKDNLEKEEVKSVFRVWESKGGCIFHGDSHSTETFTKALVFSPSEWMRACIGETDMTFLEWILSGADGISEPITIDYKASLYSRIITQIKEYEDFDFHTIYRSLEFNLTNFWNGGNVDINPKETITANLISLELQVDLHMERTAVFDTSRCEWFIKKPWIDSDPNGRVISDNYSRAIAVMHRVTIRVFPNKEKGPSIPKRIYGRIGKGKSYFTHIRTRKQACERKKKSLKTTALSLVMESPLRNLHVFYYKESEVIRLQRSITRVHPLLLFDITNPIIIPKETLAERLAIDTHQRLFHCFQYA